MGMLLGDRGVAQAGTLTVRRRVPGRRGACRLPGGRAAMAGGDEGCVQKRAVHVQTDARCGLPRYKLSSEMRTSATEPNMLAHASCTGLLLLSITSCYTWC